MNIKPSFTHLRAAAASLLCALALQGCSPGGYADGEFTARSDPDEEGGYAIVTLTIKDNSIEQCEYNTYTKSGDLKDEKYGWSEGGNQEFYAKAQAAVRAMTRYAMELERVGDITKVERISGATISFNQFNQAVSLALEQARQQKEGGGPAKEQEKEAEAPAQEG